MAETASLRLSRFLCRPSSPAKGADGLWAEDGLEDGSRKEMPYIRINPRQTPLCLSLDVATSGLDLALPDPCGYKRRHSSFTLSRTTSYIAMTAPKIAIIIE